MDLNRGLSDENPTELRRIVGGAQRENYCDTGVAAREAWWPANSETPPFHKTVHQASIMQKGRGVALPRDIDPRANIDPFHPNTPSSHQVTSPRSPCRAFHSFPPSFSFTFESHFPVPTLFYIAASCFQREFSDLFDDIVISLILLLVVSIRRNCWMEFWNF